MTRHSEVLSEIVADVRLRRSGGARVSDIARALSDQGMIDGEIRDHLDAAFGIDIGPVTMELARDDNGAFVPDRFDARVEPLIAATGAAWRHAPPYPDLLRRRDRHAFRGLAEATGKVFVVQAANPHAAAFVGRPGFKAFDMHLLDIASNSGPAAGLAAADPQSLALRDALSAQGLTYDQYLQRLAAAGRSVGTAAEGFVIRDHEGTRFFPGYRLLGVYGARSGSSAWSNTAGERMRWQLNRQMGEDLVLFGPHDDWANRRALPSSHPLRGPLLPALFFKPDGNVRVCFDAESMQRQYRSLKVDWKALYSDDETIEDEDEDEPA